MWRLVLRISPAAFASLCGLLFAIKRKHFSSDNYKERPAEYDYVHRLISVFHKDKALVRRSCFSLSDHFWTTIYTSQLLTQLRRGFFYSVVVLPLCRAIDHVGKRALTSIICTVLEYGHS